MQRVNYNVHEKHVNWTDHLSAGELQLFNFARIFYHRPRIIFLDECTTALTEDMEERIMEELVNRYMITIVSCGHRKSLKRYHQLELSIKNNNYDLINLSKK